MFWCGGIHSFEGDDQSFKVVGFVLTKKLVRHIVLPTAESQKVFVHIGFWTKFTADFRL